MNYELKLCKNQYFLRRLKAVFSNKLHFTYELRRIKDTSDKNNSSQYSCYLFALFSQEISIKNGWLGPKYATGYFLILIFSP